MIQQVLRQNCVWPDNEKEDEEEMKETTSARFKRRRAKEILKVCLASRTRAEKMETRGWEAEKKRR